jgi:hypothetical protein
MVKTIEFESEYGKILVEVEESKRPTTRDFSSSDAAIEKSKKKFGASLEVLKNVSTAVIAKLNDVAEDLKPDEVEVKVGLKFTAEAGAIIAKTSVEGNLEVTIKWKTGSSKPIA